MGPPPGTGGRPTKFKPEFCVQATNYALLGATDADLALFFGVHQSTIHEWQSSHPEFLAALRKGKEVADAEVAKSLYLRATGYSHRAVKIFADPKTGSELIIPYTEKFPPDPTSMIFWLKNRQKDKWRDKHETELTGKDGAPIVPTMNINLSRKSDG